MSQRMNEPWKCVVHDDALTNAHRTRIEIINRNDGVIAVSELKRYGVFFGKWLQRINDMDAECNRIVACVNACAGINPEAVPEMLRLAQMVSILNENHLEIGAGRMLELVTVARNAITKAEANQ